MSRPLLDPMPEAITRSQREASNPRGSVWVTANAGSGKTYVLTARVLRLLLSGVKLGGKADRIDQLSDGTLEIIDFKTGGIPAAADMKDFDAPQLLLEAAMAREGVFPGIVKRDTSALTYIKIGLGPAAFRLFPYKLRDGMSLMQAADEITRRLQVHVDAFLLSDRLPMTARIRPRVVTGRRPRESSVGSTESREITPMRFFLSTRTQRTFGGVYAYHTATIRWISRLRPPR